MPKQWAAQCIVLNTKATKPRSAYYGLLHMILFWQYGYLLFAKYE